MGEKSRAARKERGRKRESTGRLRSERSGRREQGVGEGIECGDESRGWKNEGNMTCEGGAGGLLGREEQGEWRRRKERKPKEGTEHGRGGTTG